MAAGGTLMGEEVSTDPGPLLPARDPLTDFFWAGAREGKLMILRCEPCGFYVHWPRPMCPRCQSFDLVPTEVSGRGRLYSYTVGVQAFHPWFEARLPYILAVVELEEQKNLKLVSNVVGCDEHEVAVDMPLAVTFEPITPEICLPMFRPERGGLS
jgi:uncharacterized OB-fold protein